MENNLTIKCYGALRCRQQEIEDSFDWKKVCKAASDMCMIELDPPTFMLYHDRKVKSIVSVQGKMLLLDSNYRWSWKELKRALEQSIEALYN